MVDKKDNRDIFNDIILVNALEVADQIVAIANDPSERIRVPEPVFKEKLLPYLLRDEEKIRVDYWVNEVLRGNPNREVDVINPTNGEILFTVPAVFTNTTMFVSHKTQRALADVVHETKLISQDSKQAAKLFIEQQMANNIRTAEDDKNIERWRTIYRYYGLLKNQEPVKDVATPKIETNRRNYDDCEIVYDDD